MMLKNITLATLTAVLLASCASVPRTPPPPPPTPAVLTAEQAITTDGLLRHISVLASDDFEGRKPGTAGEDKTTAYLVEQFKALGLAPGSLDGEWLQDVDLMGITSEAKARFEAGGKVIAMTNRDDYVAATTRFLPDVDLSRAPLVFVGYGVQAPELGWDDYKGLDVHGKVIVMLINDPPVEDPAHPGQLDPKMFAGKGMTYYGRWTYKFEIASKLGAAGAIIVHETEPAAYPWNVVRNSWSGERFELDADHRNLNRVPVQGWITLDKAREIFSAAGQDYDQLKAKAKRADFQPVPLDANASFRIRNTLRSVQSHNVVARIPGSDPALELQHVIYSAHWDHLGRDTTLQGDQIYNGAVDNASGVAGLLELAKAYMALPEKPRRSILFLALTGEEQGLLGSRAYAEHPLYPINDTLADINMDSLNPWGPTRDIQVVGSGQNTLEDVLATVAGFKGRVAVPDDAPEKGGFYRSDQFEFAKVGVPGLYAGRGDEIIGKPEGYGRMKREEYIRRDYHKPSDEVNPDWDLSGMVADLQLLFEVGCRISGNGAWPAWKTGSEFKAIREQGQ